MTASLVVLLPLALLAIVALACFVGCGLSTTGTKQITDYQQYQNTVTTTNGLVAYWPLNDTSGTTAVDLGPNHFDGTYTVGPTGGFTLNQKNLVAGDTVNNDQTTPSPSVLFGGGYVNIPWQAALGPPQPMTPPLQFTLEAWVIPNWAQGDPSLRAIVSFASVPADGFALFASNDLWNAAVGDGTTEVAVSPGNNQTIVQGSLYFLVMTYDGGTGELSLWINPADTSKGPDAKSPPMTGFLQQPSSIPFFIGNGRPDMPTPQFPFIGWIQDVAFYNTVLDNTTIETHYLNGSGMQDP
jgi:hypothetical protein